MTVETLQQPSSSTSAASLELFNFELLKPLLHTPAGPRPFLPGHMRPAIRHLLAITYRCLMRLCGYRLLR
jgi:hypothetical protein